MGPQARLVSETRRMAHLTLLGFSGYGGCVKPFTRSPLNRVFSPTSFWVELNRSGRPDSPPASYWRFEMPGQTNPYRHVYAILPPYANTPYPPIRHPNSDAYDSRQCPG